MQGLAGTPVTALIALAYVTLAFLTNPFAPDPALLHHYGALRSFEVAAGEPWRLLSYAFLHFGIMHLMLNLLSLLAIGPALELSLGSARFLVLYLVSALGGGILVAVTYQPDEPVVGGSGALFGMMGAIVALRMRAGRHALQFLEDETGKRAIGIIAVNVFAGFAFQGISNACHMGGLLVGFAVTLWFLTPLRVRADRMVLALRAGLLAVLGAWLCYAMFPVARWDFLAMAWERSDRPQQRAALAAAAGRAYGQPLSDHELRMLLARLRRQ
jgi:membrane associated rhomboid family serine protease